MTRILFCAGVLSALSACRSDETQTSGDAYTCTCGYPPSLGQPALTVDVCALSAGRASELARSCAGVPEPSYCDCEPDVIDFCELGACAPR